MRMRERGSEPEKGQGGQGGQKELDREVLGAGRCTGCGACVNICPYQASYRDRTVILHACDLSQGRCWAVCPRTPADLQALRQRFGGADWTPELGPFRGLYLTRASDEGIRRRSQHGGTVSALVALALREGWIDAAGLAGQGEGLLPRPVTVRDPEAVAGLAGSRFVVSPTIAEFNRTLGSDATRIGVVATPCQALALAKMRTLSVTAPERDRGKLGRVVGLFCGWALDWPKLTALLGGKTGLAAITGMDIPPSRYHTLEVYTPAGTLPVSLDEVTPCVREACRSCDDMTQNSATFPWDRPPARGWQEARSWNQVIVRTERGLDLLEAARRRGVLEFRDVPEGNLERLKAASMGKKRAAAEAAGKTAAAPAPAARQGGRS
jgi:coenzyme F420 hydrogenase subunit beta